MTADKAFYHKETSEGVEALYGANARLPLENGLRTIQTMFVARRDIGVLGLRAGRSTSSRLLASEDFIAHVVTADTSAVRMKVVVS